MVMQYYYATGETTLCPGMLISEENELHRYIYMEVHSQMLSGCAFCGKTTVLSKFSRQQVC